MKAKKTILLITLVVMLFLGLISSQMVVNFEEFKEDPGHIEGWIKLPTVMAANNTPGAGNFGIVNVLTVTHATFDYNAGINLASSDVFEQFDGTPAVDEELDKTTPHGTAYDYVVIAQYPGSYAYNDSLSAWDPNLVRMVINITTSQGSHTVSSEVMEKGTFYGATGNGDSDTAFINFYIDNSDSGYTLGIDETFTCPIAENGCKAYRYG